MSVLRSEIVYSGHQLQVGDHVAVCWGPKFPQVPADGWHMYLALYKDWYEGVYRAEPERREVKYPLPLSVPRGTHLKFDHLEVRWHDENEVGNIGSVPSLQLGRIVYDIRDGRTGLVLPETTIVVTSLGVSDTTVHPESFLPFAGQGMEPKARGGTAQIIQLPT